MHRRDLIDVAGEVRELHGQPRHVVGHLDVENADDLLVLAVDRDPRGADLLAEDRQRMVGQRIDVGDVRIADHDVDQALIGVDVLGFADRHVHRHGARIGERDLLLGARGDRHKRRGKRERQRQPDRGAPQQRALWQTLA